MHRHSLFLGQLSPLTSRFFLGDTAPELELLGPQRAPTASGLVATWSHRADHFTPQSNWMVTLLDRLPTASAHLPAVPLQLRPNNGTEPGVDSWTAAGMSSCRRRSWGRPGLFCAHSRRHPLTLGPPRPRQVQRGLPATEAATASSVTAAWLALP